MLLNPEIGGIGSPAFTILYNKGRVGYAEGSHDLINFIASGKSFNAECMGLPEKTTPCF